MPQDNRIIRQYFVTIEKRSSYVTQKINMSDTYFFYINLSTIHVFSRFFLYYIAFIKRKRLFLMHPLLSIGSIHRISCTCIFRLKFLFKYFFCNLDSQVGFHKANELKIRDTKCTKCIFSLFISV